MEILIPITLGFILDLILGDPAKIPHPIRFIGALIAKGEVFCRRICRKDKEGEIAAGLILVIIVLICTYAVPWAILTLAGAINHWLAIAIETFFCFQIFATRSLANEGIRIFNYLKVGDIENARKYVGYIVGRDTENLDEAELTRATIETIAENTSDGVIAPMICMFIGGAPLAFLYKGINTMDSMIGYKNDKYINFGRDAAILDDIVNFIPAILTGLGMVAVSGFIGLNRANAWKIYNRDKRNHTSPNSGKPESACAGALGIMLGGDNYYFGKIVHKPTIGDKLMPTTAKHILEANKLLFATSIFLFVVFLIIKVGVML